MVDPVSDASSPVLRDGTVVAAWLFKANPEVWDIFGHIRRGAPLDAWRMTPSYRVALVRPGHRAVLWITGQRGSGHVPGVWAIGEVTGDPYEDVGDPDDPLVWISRRTPVSSAPRSCGALGWGARSLSPDRS